MFGVFNFLGIFIMSIFNSKVAFTIFNLVSFDNSNKSLIALIISLIVIILWSTVAGKKGIPTSESHALVASLTGAALAVGNNLSEVDVFRLIDQFYGKRKLVAFEDIIKDNETI